MRPIPAAAFVLGLSALALSPAAQEAPTPTPTPPCTSSEHREFDFWVGAWRVTDAAGTFQGINRIEKILDGCVLEESWNGAQGSRGHSFNLYSKGRARWHQTWVDARGLLLLLDGGLVDGSMVLEGTTPRPDGGDLHHRITWTPLDDGRVRQHWQTSTDGGATWTDAFDGYYTRIPE